MNKKFTKLIAAVALLVFMMPSLVAWGQTSGTITYTFTDKDWKATDNDNNTANWTDYTSGDSFESASPARGIAKSKATINGTSPDVINDITSVTVVASANQAGPTLTIYKVVGNTETSIYSVSMTKDNNKDYTVNLTGNNVFSGKIKVVLASSSSYKSVWIKSVSVSHTTGGSSTTPTTVTIDDTDLTNTDVYISTAAGSLSATVKDNDNNVISGATVSWESSDENVATIDANGVVTLVAAGTTTITASYAGVANQYQASYDDYELVVTSSAPYVQPTTIEIIPNYTFWGKTAQFSGSTYDELSGSKDNVSLNWTRGSGSTYANQNAMRFYKDNTLTFTSPTGYEIKSIVLDVEGTYNDLAFSPAGFDTDTKTWSGSSSTVTMTRPSNASSYATINTFTITIGLPSSIATPSFSPGGGTYTEDQNVTISCITAGATIYYTTDGTAPSATNGTQGTSVAINTTTTLKAIAIKDGESSAVATAVYTLPQEFATIAAFKAAFSATSTEVVKITGPLTVVYQNGINTYVQDATGGLLIYDSDDKVTGTYENGQTVSNIYGTYTKYKGLVEFVPDRDLPAAGTGTVVEPMDITSLTSANYSQYESMLVRLSDIMFAANATLSTTGNIENVTMYIDDAYTEVVLRNGFKTLAGSIAEADMANVTGFATIYNSTIQLFPRDNNDVQMILSTTEVNSAVTVDFAAILGSNDMIEINYGGSLTIGGTFINEGNEENIIIEDGGQLYTEDVVEATIKKNISQYTIAANDDTDPDNVVLSNGWYFISSPLNSNGGWGYAPTEVVNLIPNNDVESTQYDLYLFDPSADMEWVNYKAHQDEGEFLLYNGHGYLYSNAADVTLEFAGSVNYPEPEISLEQGYNLVGNPYTYNAYPSVSYYKMNDDHTGLSAVIANTVAVEPCTGIIVDNSDGEIPEITFSKSGGAKGGINLTLAETKRGVNKLDNAIVSFNEGSQLGKFYFGTQNANLYIPQGTKEYAIVSANGQGEMPVNFKANEDGQYTLTVNPENVEMNYLHLIDNMTGANVDLLQTPSYSFNAKTTDYESRFRLVFASNDASTGSASDETFAFFSDGNLIINNEGQATLQVMDITGRILSSETVDGSVSKTINATPGVYMLRLVNGDNVKVQKVVVR